MYCNLGDNIGITVPPADFIAAVEPVAVQIRNPLDRECMTGVSNSSASSLLILHQVSKRVSKCPCVIGLHQLLTIFCYNRVRTEDPPDFRFLCLI